MFYFDTIHSVDINAGRPGTLSNIEILITIKYIYHSFVCCIMGKPSENITEFIIFLCWLFNVMK